jgi:hypothetical protein
MRGKIERRNAEERNIWVLPVESAAPTPKSVIGWYPTVH